MSNKAHLPKPDGYVVDNGEYVSPTNLPANAKLTDPVKVARLKERTRDRILNRPRPPV